MKDYIGKRCTHKETGSKGIITKTLNGNDKFPFQLGIGWISGANKLNYPNMYFWNDFDKIEIEL